ncbi:unnamed protein product [Sphagnum balticum]
MAGIPNSGVADKIREIDEQESHWKSDTNVVDTNLEDTMASNHNSGAEEKICDVCDQESNWMSDWRKSERICKIVRSLVIYGGQNGDQAEQNGGRAEQNRGKSEQNGGQDHRVTIFNRKEVQYLLTLDALTLLLVLTRHVDGSPILVNILAKDTKAMDRLLLPKMQSSNMPSSNMPLESSNMPFIGLSDDLFLLENQVPMDLLTKVMIKCSEILNDQKKRSLRKREIPDPFLPQELLDSSLKAIAKQMCFSVFIGPNCPTDDKEK